MKKVTAIIVALIVLLASGLAAQESTKTSNDYLGQTPPGDVPLLFARGIVSRGASWTGAYLHSERERGGMEGKPTAGTGQQRMALLRLECATRERRLVGPLSRAFR